MRALCNFSLSDSNGVQLGHPSGAAAFVLKIARFNPTLFASDKRTRNVRFDKLTTKFQEALSDAQSLAAGRDQQYIEPVHVLLALLEQSDGSSRSLLQRAGVNVQRLETELRNAI